MSEAAPTKAAAPPPPSETVLTASTPKKTVAPVPSQKMAAAGISESHGSATDQKDIEEIAVEEAGNSDGDLLKIHYRNDLKTEAEKREAERLKEYPLSIDYDDWAKILLSFTSFYFLLALLFYLAAVANYEAETNEVGAPTPTKPTPAPSYTHTATRFS